MIHFNNTIEKCKFFVHNQIFFMLKLKCVSFEIGIFWSLPVKSISETVKDSENLSTLK